MPSNFHLVLILAWHGFVWLLLFRVSRGKKEVMSWAATKASISFLFWGPGSCYKPQDPYSHWMTEVWYGHGSTICMHKTSNDELQPLDQCNTYININNIDFMTYATGPNQENCPGLTGLIINHHHWFFKVSLCDYEWLALRKKKYLNDLDMNIFSTIKDSTPATPYPSTDKLSRPMDGQ